MATPTRPRKPGTIKAKVVESGKRPAAPKSGKRGAPARGERLDLRITAEAKRQLERAAALSGETISMFVLRASLGRARSVIRESGRITLSARDRARFLAALDREEPRLIEALNKAFARNEAATRG
jgi:uncharacterized protein (DUF1778 family)